MRTGGSSTRCAGRPGLVVLHDFVLHHLVAGMTIGRRDGHGYLDAMEREHGVVGRLLAHGVLDKRIRRCGRTGPRTSRSRARCSSLATALVTHSPTSATAPARRASPDRSRRPAPRLPRARRPAGRRRRRPALRDVREREREQARPAAARGARARAAGSSRCVRPPRRSASPGFDLDRRLQRLGLDGGGTIREGYVDEARLWELMKACDVHVSLRSPTMGETSGTAIRALSLGKPLIVSDVGWFAELPDDVALKVAPDNDEVGALVAALELLATRPDVRGAMGEAALELARAGTHSTASPTSTSPPSRRQRAAARSRTRCSATSAERRQRSGSSPARPTRARSQPGSPRSSSVTEKVRGVPAWAWLAVLVLVSFLFRAWVARGMSAPFIMVDELIYSELAKSFAATGRFLVRDVPTSGYGLVYPVVISPAYALFDRSRRPTRP